MEGMSQIEGGVLPPSLLQRRKKSKDPRRMAKEKTRSVRLAVFRILC